MLLVAHRTPQTMAACWAMIAAGASVFEVDLQLNGDDVVVSHFFPVHRRLRWIEHDNWKLRLAGVGRFDPTLAEVADRVPVQARFLLDLKEKAPDRRAGLIKRIIEVVDEPGRCHVSSPEPDDLADLRRAGFHTWRTIDDLQQLAAVKSAGSIADEAVTVRHTLLTADAIETLLTLSQTLIAWTVNRPERAVELAARGVTGITTDSITVMKAVAQK